MIPLVGADLGPGARGAFTTRAGGVSAGPYAGPAGTGGLNLGLGVHDDPAAVRHNRAAVAEALGAPVAWMTQVHGAEVRTVTAAAGDSQGECDALVAAGPVALAVLVADCVPVLLAGGGVVAAAHVGRRGLVTGVLAAALRAVQELGTGPESVRAVIGPAVCGRCYEVPQELADDVGARVPGTSSRTSWGTPALDLPAGVAAQLRAAGVRDVVRTGACTLEDERFYSYRRAGRTGSPVTGRFAGLVVAGP